MDQSPQSDEDFLKLRLKMPELPPFNKDALFKLKSSFEPKGDQPRAIQSLVRGLNDQRRHQVLLGVTGSGKTYTVAQVVARVEKPTLVLAPNKTLAAQLYSEFKEFFPENCVEYFVSYYDYYQPEAYVPSTDTFIEKDASINDEIDKLRHRATRAVLERKDVVVVSSVSCIYGIGDPEEYGKMLLRLFVGEEMSREGFLNSLIELQYVRRDYDFTRGSFRVRGDVVEIFPPSEEDHAVRLEWFGDELDAISIVDPLRGKTLDDVDRITLYPASHYVTSSLKRKSAIQSIQKELQEHLQYLNSEKKSLEAQRVEQRTLYDLEMMEELGYCNGIENYSRHLTGRKPGAAPPTLIDYFPKDFLMVIDESHLTVSQVGGMYRGDRARKETLVAHGFRLPSALDNRPLNFQEFEERLHQAIYVSATPADYELKKSEGEVVEQIIRPTGLLDPEVELRPAKDQVDDLLAEIRQVTKTGYRVLVTTLTKKMAEDLTDYLKSVGIKVQYLHSDIDTLERIEILRKLRLGEIDVLIGINLLREGLDLPEVALVGILDADKEGFLRSERSLIQTIGRAARNVDGRVVLYADQITGSIQKALDETNRRRRIQKAYNKEHNITPASIKKGVHAGPSSSLGYDERGSRVASGQENSLSSVLYDLERARAEKEISQSENAESLDSQIKNLQNKMKKAAKDLRFEEAAKIRDQLKDLKQLRLKV